jgi:hypothetical protein
MKKILALCAALALSVVMVVPAAAAAPSPSKGSATQFTASYVYGGLPFTCSGVQVANKNVTKDNETCLVTGAGPVAGTYTSGAGGWGILPPFGSVQWASDYNGVTATSWTITEADNGNGTFTFSIAAIYP